MHYEMVDGYPMPARFAGHPALELCNTWSGWADPPVLGARVDPHREYLADAERLFVWAGHVGLLDEEEVAALRRATAAAPAARALREARRLRVDLYAALVGSSRSRHGLPSRREGFDGLAAAADAAARVSRLVAADDGVVARREVQLDGPMTVVHRAALAAECLLVGADARRVRACPGDGCGWLFVDATGRRRWCSMASCGNRAKVRAHASRDRRA